MITSRFNIWLVWFAIMTLGISSASGQSYPNKPIRIVTATPGGASDFTARLIAQGISGPLGQQVIVDNRGGVIAPEIVAKAPPDGYTLLVSGTTLWIGSLLDKVSFDPVKDFLPITLAASSPSVLVVYPSLPVKSVKELIVLAKTKPGTLNYGTGGFGSTPHLSAELFNAMANVNIVCINYKGGGQALSDLIGGQLNLMFPTAGSVSAYLNSGRLRAMAVTSARPSALFPSLPTVAAGGLPGYESISMSGAFAPAKTPKALINRLSHEIAGALNRPDMKERFLAGGVEVVTSSPEQFASTIRSDMVKWESVIKNAGIGKHQK